MSNDLKDTWKKTGIGLGHAFRDLGKAVLKSGAVAVKKADEWANREEDEKAPDTGTVIETEEVE